MTALILLAMTCSFYAAGSLSIESDRIERDGAIVVCEEPVHDFGMVWSGEELRHTFVLRNEGVAAAYLRARPMTASREVREFVLPPLTECALTDHLNSRKLNGPFEKGWQVELLPCQTNEAVNRTNELPPDSHGTTEYGRKVFEEGLNRATNGVLAVGGVYWRWWGRPTYQDQQRELAARVVGRGQSPRLEAKIVCDDPEHDFGVVWVDAELCHTFVLKSVGKEAARIKVYSGAGTSENSEHTIEVGSTLDLKFCLNPRKLNGPFEKAIAVVMVA